MRKTKLTKFLFSLISVITLISLTVFFVLRSVHPVQAAWYNENWSYRRGITITNNTTAETNVYVPVTLSTSDATRFQSNCYDLRFTDASGEPLHFYAVSGCGTGSTVIHVFLPTFPAGTQTIYYYYGNPNAASGLWPSDFSTVASSYAVGSTASEETGPGPVLYLKFDEGTGQTVYSSMQSAINGTLGANTGSAADDPTWQTPEFCVSGKCLKYNGTSQYVNVADNNALHITGDITLEAFAKITNTPGQNSVIISKGYTGTTENYGLYVTPAGNVVFQYYNGSQRQLTFTPSGYNVGQWYHYAVSISSGSVSVYRDGVPLGSAQSLPAALVSNTNSLRIGGISSGTNWLSGFIDDVKIFNYARTQTKIDADYTAAWSTNSTSQGVSASLGGNQDQYNLLNNSLIGYWKLDESSGTPADSTGNTATALTNVNTVSYYGVKFGNAGFFTRASSRYFWGASAANSILDQTGSVSVTAWIKPASITAATSFDIAGKWDGATNTSYLLRQYGTEIQYFIGGSGNYLTTSGAGLAVNGLYHIVGVYDSNLKTAYVYINGTAETTVLTGSIPSSITSNAGRFHIGADSSTGGAANFYNGYIDDVRVYRKALTSQDVTNLYNWAPGPVGWWRLDEGSVTNDCATYNLLDSTGNGNNARSCPAVAGSTKSTVGKVGKAIKLDGTQGYLDAGNNTSIEGITGEVTLTGWVKLDKVGLDQKVAGNQAFTTGGGFKMSVFYDGTANNMNTLEFEIRDASNTPWLTRGIAGATTLSAGTWYFFAGVYSQSGGYIRDYLNGVLDRNYSMAGIMSTTTGLMLIGKENSGSAYLGATVDDFRVYAYSMNEKQLTQVMNTYRPLGSNLIGTGAGYWKFDENSGSTAHDSGNSGNDLTLSSASWSTDGKYGSSWLGTGTNRLSHADVTSLDFTGFDDFSISAWAKHDTQTTSGTTATYYFNAQSASAWTSPNNMVDGSTATFANSGTNAQSETLSANSSTGTNLGTITKVEMRYHGYKSSSTVRARMQPIFAGGNGTNYDPGDVLGTGAGAAAYTAYHDITTDTNAPSPWTWAAVQNLDSYIISNRPSSGTVYVSRVEIRVSYTPTNPGSEYLVAKSDSTNGGYKLYMNNRRYCFGIDDSATWTPKDEICTTTNYDDNLWHHIVAVKSGTTSISLYVDNYLKNSKTPISATGTLVNTGTFYVGDQDGTDNGDEWIGSVNELQLIRGALTPTDISVLYNRGSAAKLGSSGTDSSGDPSDSTARAYCVPGDTTSTCNTPLGEWRFDEGSGTSNTADTSGNGLVTTLNNSPTWITGKIGKALQFNGSSQSVTATLGSNPGYTNTVEAWIYPTSSVAGKTIVTNLTADGTSYPYYGNCTSSTALTTYTWTHIAAVSNGSGSCKIYQNGLLTASNTTGVTFGTGVNIGSSSFAGIIDNVTIYATARNVAQIAWDYNRGLPISWYKFDECQGATANDAMGNQNGTITIGGTAPQTTLGTCITPTDGTGAWYNGLEGKFNSSIKLDGVDDYVDLGDQPTLENTSQFSVAFWVKPGTLDVGKSFIAKGNSDVTQTSWAISTDAGGSSRIRGTISANTTDASNYGYTPDNNLTAGTWAHVVMVFDGTQTGNANRLKIYINTIPITLTFAGSGIPATTTATSSNVTLGLSSDHAASTGQIGQYDDVQLFNYPLTQSQINNAYNQSASTRFGPSKGTP